MSNINNQDALKTAIRAQIRRLLFVTYFINQEGTLLDNQYLVTSKLMICYQSFWEISADDYVNTKYQRCLTLLLMDNPQKVKYLSTSKLTKSMEI